MLVKGVSLMACSSRRWTLAFSERSSSSWERAAALRDRISSLWSCFSVSSFWIWDAICAGEG